MRHASTFQSAFLLLPVAARAGDAFQRITPAQAGYSEAGLQALAQLLDEAGSESMLLLHDGKVFFEWGDIRQKRLVHSLAARPDRRGAGEGQRLPGPGQDRGRLRPGRRASRPHGPRKSRNVAPAVAVAQNP